MIISFLNKNIELLLSNLDALISVTYIFMATISNKKLGRSKENRLPCFVSNLNEENFNHSSLIMMLSVDF